MTFRFSQEAAFMALRLVDRFFSKSVLSIEDVEFVAHVSVFISDKLTSPESYQLTMASPPSSTHPM